MVDIFGSTSTTITLGQANGKAQLANGSASLTACIPRPGTKFTGLVGVRGIDRKKKFRVPLAVKILSSLHLFFIASLQIFPILTKEKGNQS